MTNYRLFSLRISKQKKERKEKNFYNRIYFCFDYVYAATVHCIELKLKQTITYTSEYKTNIKMKS